MHPLPVNPAISEPQRRIYTVSQLTSAIKDLLEANFSFVWLTGEISNFRMPVSGHFYFVLKDRNAQIQAVMFRGQNKLLKFTPEDGMTVTGLGRIGLYEARGNYQIILEYLEPKGIGALQVAFEQLKARLSDEGLFDPAHKKRLPFLPRKIGMVTSPTGAVVHDVLNIVYRRFPNVSVLIFPVKVQGFDSEREIAGALDFLNTRSDIDLIILARGGGSLEDLQAFNSETVARAIFRSSLPVVSAVGHETDFTISDWVADLRASTPSAAAELVVPVKYDLERKVLENFFSLKSAFYRKMENLRGDIWNLSRRLVDPSKRIQELMLKADDLMNRMMRSLQNGVASHRERLRWHTRMLISQSLLNRIPKYHSEVEQIKYNLLLNNKKYISELKKHLESTTGKLTALGPQSILDRGFSIARTLPDHSVVRNIDSVEFGQIIEVILTKGSLTCLIKDKNK